MRTTWMLGLVACGTTRIVPDEQDTRGLARTALAIEAEPFVAGRIATITVTGLGANESTRIVTALGAGAGPCPGVLGGLCLDLDPATARAKGVLVADPTGVASLDLQVPSGLAGQTVFVQAAAIRGAGGAASVKSPALEIDVVAAASDLDGDGFDSLDDCDDSDAAVHPGAHEICDGVDDDCDPSTTEDGTITDDLGVGYATFADAVLRTPTGSVVSVCAGTWDGGVLVDRPLTIRGFGRPVIAGDGADSVVRITVNDVVVEGLDIEGGSAFLGGGVFVESAFVTLRDLVIRENAANFGGGVAYSRSAAFFGQAGVLTLEDVEIVDNHASNEGGGLFSGVYAVDATRVTIAENTAVDGAGLMISGFVLEPGDLTLVDSVVRDNVASGRGGGLFVENSGVEATTSSVVANDAANDGGGVYLFGSGIDFVSCDLGVGAAENLPDDVSWGSGSVAFLGANTTVRCDGSGC